MTFLGPLPELGNTILPLRLLSLNGFFSENIFQTVCVEASNEILKMQPSLSKLKLNF